MRYSLPTLLGLVFVSTAAAQPPEWERMRKLNLGNLRLFWDVAAGEENERRALEHGFAPVRLVSPLAKHPLPGNPWAKPADFEASVRKSLTIRPGGAIIVHDIEFPYDEDFDKLWANETLRAASKAKTPAEFRAAYFKEWAKWYADPVRWTREAHPKTPVGIYGPAPFHRDFTGQGGKDAEPIDGTHRTDEELWPLIEPAVDFVVASIYCFHDDASSVYYMAANVEENVARTKKPVYAYTWLRYHEANKALKNRELDQWLVESMAIVPYFCGAKGVVLWGSEPKATGQPYEAMPAFLVTLGRLADNAEKLGRATVVPGEPAHVLWKEKRPLVRVMKVSGGEWFVLASNPWQQDDATTEVRVRLGDSEVTLPVIGKRPRVYRVEGKNVWRL